jgi:flagellar basal body rod protein FlgG
MIDFGVPLSGMTQAMQQLDRTASRIATPETQNPQGDTVDLSSDMVALLQARQNFEANAKALHTENDLTKTMLDTIE